MKVLREAGLIEKTKHSRMFEHADVYQLTVPGPTTCRSRCVWTLTASGSKGALRSPPRSFRRRSKLWKTLWTPLWTTVREGRFRAAPM